MVTPIMVMMPRLPNAQYNRSAFFFPYVNHKGLLAGSQVVVMIAVIVQNKQRINYQSAGYRYENRFQAYSCMVSGITR